MITQQRLKQVVYYHAASGDLVRLEGRTNAPTGKQLGTPIAPGGHLRLMVDGCSGLAHQFIWLYMTGEWPRQDVDHRDLNQQNNAWNNLRLATDAQNCQNRARRVDNTTGFKGVDVRRDRGKFRAVITTQGRRKYLGLFDSAEEAHAAYVRAADLLHGEFARG